MDFYEIDSRCRQRLQDMDRKALEQPQNHHTGGKWRKTDDDGSATFNITSMPPTRVGWTKAGGGWRRKYKHDS